MSARASANEFPYEGLVPVGAADGSDSAWVRIPATGRGIDLVRTLIAGLGERARKAEAALEAANTRARSVDPQRDAVAWDAYCLRSAEFEWEDTIPVDEPGGDRVLVRVRGTEDGIGKIKARMEQLVFFNGLLNRSLASASDRALEAEAKVATLEAEKAEALACVAGFQVLPIDATTYTVSCGDATMTVTGYPSGVANVVKLAYGGFEYGASA